MHQHNFPQSQTFLRSDAKFMVAAEQLSAELNIVQLVKNCRMYLTIIVRGHTGYQMIDKQRGT